MDTSSLLIELYERIPPLAERAVEGLDTAELTRSPAPGVNTIGWLIWHLTRVQDHHVSEILDTDQLWVQGDWAARVGVDADPTNTGYGHSAGEMRSIRPESGEALLDHLGAVQRRTITMLRNTTADDLDRVVDDNWDPPVTLGVRLISIADDSLQHVGQANYLRGLLDD